MIPEPPPAAAKERRQIFLRGLCASQLVAGVLLHLTVWLLRARCGDGMGTNAYLTVQENFYLVLAFLLLPVVSGAVAAWIWEPLRILGVQAGCSALLLTGAGSGMAYLLFGAGNVYLYRFLPVLFLLTLAGIEQGRNFAQSRQRPQP